LLLARGDVSDRQLQLALEAQRTDQSRKIGEWLQLLEFVSERQVLAGLGLQWGLPVLSSPQCDLPDVARLLPAGLRRELGLVPVRMVESTNELYVASRERLDYTILAAIEHMLERRIRPCLVSEQAISRWLSSAYESEEDLAQHFERVTSPSELARIICSYAQRLHCDDLRITRCAAHIWVRLTQRRETAHLLFRLGEAPRSVASRQLPAAV
jgi:hypothetical protein